MGAFRVERVLSAKLALSTQGSRRGKYHALLHISEKKEIINRPQERPKTRKRTRRTGRGGALIEGRIAKAAKTRQERRWTSRYWTIGGRLSGGWLEATPASSRPTKVKQKVDLGLLFEITC